MTKHSTHPLNINMFGVSVCVGSFKTLEEANDVKESLVQKLSTTNYETKEDFEAVKRLVPQKKKRVVVPGKNSGAFKPTLKDIANLYPNKHGTHRARARMFGDKINIFSFKKLEEGSNIKESLVQKLSTTNYETKEDLKAIASDFTLCGRGKKLDAWKPIINDI